MVEFKVMVSDPKSGRAYPMTVSGGAAGIFVGRKIGDEVDGGPIGLTGYKLQITGGSDRDGTPARKDLSGMGRKRILLSGGVGFKPVHDGERRRKFVRGNEITTEFVQINAKVTTHGEKALAEYFVKSKEEKAAAE
ncbi:MAG: 30S ribosomal protein S6e [Methanomicrobiales archaeon]|nr:30S ribosomal protein S6e [Methanomicrobiales archaeon]